MSRCSQHARKLGITVFSSPFDNTAVDLLEELDAPAYKIASFEAVDLPLIKYVASTGKPMIMSTGMADAEEIQEAIDAARDRRLQGAGHPALRQRLSRTGRRLQPAHHPRHDRGASAWSPVCRTTRWTTQPPSPASRMGASLIEKHFTLDRAGGGPDDSFSLEPDELAALCSDSKTAWAALGRVDYGRKPSEQGNVKFRRSLYFVKDMKAGDVITADCIRSVRPGFGMPPKALESLIGKKLTSTVKRFTRVKPEVFE